MDLQMILIPTSEISLPSSAADHRRPIWPDWAQRYFGLLPSELCFPPPLSRGPALVRLSAQNYMNAGWLSLCFVSALKKARQRCPLMLAA